MNDRRLQLDVAHQLVPLDPGTWRMTGRNPQFLVHGPFARGFWEWQLRAGVRTDTRASETRIAYALDRGFSRRTTVRFPPLPRDPGVRTLRFWLPWDAAVLRFDPADAAGTLVLGEVRARRRGRMSATLAAFARHARRHGVRGVVAWLRELNDARRAGGTALRARMVELMTAEEWPDAREWVAAMVAARAAGYRATPERGLLSILTTVYDTPGRYLRELGDSLAAQTWRDYEWIVLDNGSRRRSTRNALAAIAADPRVTLLSAE